MIGFLDSRSQVSASNRSHLNSFLKFLISCREQIQKDLKRGFLFTAQELTSSSIDMVAELVALSYRVQKGANAKFPNTGKERWVYSDDFVEKF